MGGSFAHVIAHLGTDTRLSLSTFPDRAPILAVEVGSVTLSLSKRGVGEVVTADDLQVARDLHRSAGAYVAELERLHAVHTTVNAQVSVASAS
jgi:hypothetical protein